MLGSLQFVPIYIEDCQPFYVNMRAGHEDLLKGSPWKTPPWEYAEQSIMRKIVREGEVVFDIGANIGLHTVLLSKLIGPSGRLCVFEPNGELLPQLELTVKGLKNATLHPFALSNKSETAALFVPEDAAEMGSLANWTSGRDDLGRIRTLDCEVRRIDDLIESGTIPQPNFIKCDVEGAELLVFQGGLKALNRDDAPVIMFEANVYNAIGFGLKIDDAKNFLANLTLPTYSFYEIQEDGSLTQNDEMNPVHSNILAVPELKLEQTLKLVRQ
jgi:FkbM family methyltransferase